MSAWVQKQREPHVHANALQATKNKLRKKGQNKLEKVGKKRCSRRKEKEAKQSKAKQSKRKQAKKTTNLAHEKEYEIVK